MGPLALAQVGQTTGQSVGSVPVDLELVLAVDSSASVDAREFGQQMNGLALAFRDEAVVEAATAGPNGAIAVTVIEWSSVGLQIVSVPWRIIDGSAAAEALADILDGAPRQVETGATSISTALLFAIALFDNNGFEGLRRVVDISGDGFNNQGVPTDVARSAADKAGVTVNGLAIENQVLGLGDYFEHNLITGLGAFVERADDYEDYVDAIRRKLLREIRDVPMG